jgi:hypothetical protein
MPRYKQNKLIKDFIDKVSKDAKITKAEATDALLYEMYRMSFRLYDITPLVQQNHRQLLEKQ